MQEVRSWSAPTRGLHALMLFMFIVMYTLAELMDWTHGASKHEVVEIHKSIGVLIFFLALLRLSWNLTHRGPEPIGTPQQAKLAKGVHHLLYLLMLVIPLSGYVMSMLYGKSVDIFGWCTLPSLIAANPAFKEWSENIHSALATTLLIVAGGHAAMALYHHFVLKDVTLRRMFKG